MQSACKSTGKVFSWVAGVHAKLINISHAHAKIRRQREINDSEKPTLNSNSSYPVEIHVFVIVRYINSARILEKFLRIIVLVICHTRV